MSDDQEAMEIASFLETLFKSKPGLTSPDRLYSAARRQARGRALRITKEHVRGFLEDEGRHHVYKEKAARWPGEIQKPSEPDRVFDLDGLDLRKQSPDIAEQEGYQHILMMQDRFTRKLFAVPLKTRGVRETLDAVKEMLRQAEAEDDVREINMDLAGEFSSREEQPTRGYGEDKVRDQNGEVIDGRPTKVSGPQHGI